MKHVFALDSDLDSGKTIISTASVTVKKLCSKRRAMNMRHSTVFALYGYNHLPLVRVFMSEKVTQTYANVFLRDLFVVNKPSSLVTVTKTEFCRFQTATSLIWNLTVIYKIIIKKKLIGFARLTVALKNAGKEDRWISNVMM